MGQWPTPGLNHVDEYAASGWPWVETGNLTESTGPSNNIVVLEFPAVTRFLVVHNAGDNELQFAFANADAIAPPVPLPPGKVADDYRALGFYTESDPEQRYFVVQPRETSPSLEIKCKKLYLRAVGGNSEYSVIVGYTNIPKEKLPDFENERAKYGGV